MKYFFKHCRFISQLLLEMEGFIPINIFSLFCTKCFKRINILILLGTILITGTVLWSKLLALLSIVLRMQKENVPGCINCLGSKNIRSIWNLWRFWTKKFAIFLLLLTNLSERRKLILFVWSHMIQATKNIWKTIFLIFWAPINSESHLLKSKCKNYTHSRNPNGLCSQTSLRAKKKIIQK